MNELFLVSAQLESGSANVAILGCLENNDSMERTT